MTFDEYQKEAVKTRTPSADERYLSAKLMIEAGELAQHIFKSTYHGKPLSIDAIKDEMSDCLWYIANLADFYDLNLDAIAAQNVAKLRQRHGDSYNAAHYQDGAAVAGSMTTACSMTPSAGPRPNVSPTTYPSGMCTPPAEAVVQLRDWTPDARPVIVQGSDMTAFWRLWGGEVQA